MKQYLLATALSLSITTAAMAWPAIVTGAYSPDKSFTMDQCIARGLWALQKASPLVPGSSFVVEPGKFGAEAHNDILTVEIRCVPSTKTIAVFVAGDNGDNGKAASDAFDVIVKTFQGA